MHKFLPDDFELDDKGRLALIGLTFDEIYEFERLEAGLPFDGAQVGQPSRPMFPCVRKKCGGGSYDTNMKLQSRRDLNLSGRHSSGSNLPRLVTRSILSTALGRLAAYSRETRSKRTRRA